MATRLSDITKILNGARFYTADLHVHSYGASADVSDPGMTVEAIVDTAAAEGISVISITDHNTDRNTEKSLDCGTKYSGQLLILPGVEITTANGHLLVYFSPTRPEAIGTLLGRIKLAGKPGSRESHTTSSMADVIKEAESLGGIRVAAHIDRPKMGFETMIAGYPNAKKDIVTSSGLYGLEFDDSAHLVWYSRDDEPTPDGASRKQILNARQTQSATAARTQFAAVQNSDAHTLNDLKTLHQKRVLTKIKMSSLEFDGVRTAFTDPEARVRATTMLPPAIPRMIGLQINGGFLDNSVFHFSPNLNCFIGGRGTGKSTALKSVAYALGIDDELAEHDNCPDNVVLYCQDDNGIYYRYERVRGNEPQALASERGQQGPTEVPKDAFRIEYYGQGDLARVSHNPLGQPALLQDFLDRHIVLNDLASRERALLSELEQNSAQLMPVEASAAQLVGKEKELKGVEQKLKVAEEGNLKEVAAFQSRVAAEKSLLEELEKIGAFYERGMSLANFLRDFDAAVGTVGALTDRPEVKTLLDKIKSTIGDTNKYLNETEQTINAQLKRAAAEVRGVIKQIKEQHAHFDSEISAKTVALQSRGLSGSLKELSELLNSRGVLNRDVLRIRGAQPLLADLRKKRADLLQELRTVRAEMLARRKKQLAEINRNLRLTIDDYNINLYYDAAGIIEDFFSLLSEVMHGSYLHDQVMRTLCEKVQPEVLAEFIRRADLKNIAATCGVDATQAMEIYRCFSLAELHCLETVNKPARPVIKVVTKTTPAKQIPVNQLSDGQKHTILLTIAMLAQSNLPLLLDQPEDDLDNAFIFKSVVTTLRAIKERRQVVLVTHNANIAVLGDSELILPMRRASQTGAVFDAGAIDHPDTRKAVQQVLEGGETAFQRRKAIYGY